MQPNHRRFVSASLCGVYFLSQVVLAHATERNLWVDRQNAIKSSQKAAGSNTQLAALGSDLTALRPISPLSASSPTPLTITATKDPRLQRIINVIPQRLATLQEIHTSSSEQAPIVLIQDVHMNAEAQKNIAAVLDAITQEERVRLVGVEGAFERFDFSPYHAIKNKQIVSKVANAFLDNKLMAAASYAGIVSEHAIPPFVGVDDRLHYGLNVRAYLTARKTQEKIGAVIDSSNRKLANDKQQIFTPDLIAFDQARNAFLANELSLGAYAKKLTAYHVEPGLDLERFLAAITIENALDFRRVETERQQVLRLLASRLTQQETSLLLSASLRYRSGDLAFGDYYRLLKSLCSKNGVSLDQTPAFATYVRYVLISDGIKSAGLFNDIAKAERAIETQLATSPHAQELLRQSEKLSLSRKLVSFELTSQEWHRYRALPQPPYISASDLAAFEQFYIQADIRSQKMLTNVLAQQNKEPAALIIGGFHTQEIADVLEQRDVPYLVISPKLTHVDATNGSAYLSVFAREKSSLDTLFKGEKLFLSPADQQIETTHGGLPPLAAMQAEEQQKRSVLLTWKNRLLRVTVPSNMLDVSKYKVREPILNLLKRLTTAFWNWVSKIISRSNVSESPLADGTYTHTGERIFLQGIRFGYEMPADFDVERELSAYAASTLGLVSNSLHARPGTIDDLISFFMTFPSESMFRANAPEKNPPLTFFRWLSNQIKEGHQQRITPAALAERLARDLSLIELQQTRFQEVDDAPALTADNVVLQPVQSIGGIFTSSRRVGNEIQTRTYKVEALRKELRGPDDPELKEASSFIPTLFGVEPNQGLHPRISDVLIIREIKGLGTMKRGPIVAAVSIDATATRHERMTALGREYLSIAMERTDSRSLDKAFSPEATEIVNYISRGVTQITHEDDPTGEVVAIGVAPEHRGFGLVDALLYTAEFNADLVSDNKGPRTYFAMLQNRFRQGFSGHLQQIATAIGGTRRHRQAVFVRTSNDTDWKMLATNAVDPILRARQEAHARAARDAERERKQGEANAARPWWLYSFGMPALLLAQADMGPAELALRVSIILIIYFFLSRHQFAAERDDHLYDDDGTITDISASHSGQATPMPLEKPAENNDQSPREPDTKNEQTKGPRSVEHYNRVVNFIAYYIAWFIDDELLPSIHIDLPNIALSNEDNQEPVGAPAPTEENAADVEEEDIDPVTLFITGPVDERHSTFRLLDPITDRRAINLSLTLDGSMNFSTDEEWEDFVAIFNTAVTNWKKENVPFTHDQFSKALISLRDHVYDAAIERSLIDQRFEDLSFREQLLFIFRMPWNHFISNLDLTDASKAKAQGERVLSFATAADKTMDLTVVLGHVVRFLPFLTADGQVDFLKILARLNRQYFLPHNLYVSMSLAGPKHLSEVFVIDIQKDIRVPLVGVKEKIRVIGGRRVDASGHNLPYGHFSFRQDGLVFISFENLLEKAAGLAFTERIALLRSVLAHELSHAYDSENIQDVTLSNRYNIPDEEWEALTEAERVSIYYEVNGFLTELANTQYPQRTLAELLEASQDIENDLAYYYASNFILRQLDLRPSARPTIYQARDIFNRLNGQEPLYIGDDVVREFGADWYFLHETTKPDSGRDSSIVPPVSHAVFLLSEIIHTFTEKRNLSQGATSLTVLFVVSLLPEIALLSWLSSSDWFQTVQTAFLLTHFLSRLVLRMTGRTSSKNVFLGSGNDLLVLASYANFMWPLAAAIHVAADVFWHLHARNQNAQTSHEPADSIEKALALGRSRLNGWIPPASPTAAFFVELLEKDGIPIQFSDDLGGSDAAFDSDMRNESGVAILINNRFQNAPEQILIMLIVHEAFHYYTYKAAGPSAEFYRPFEWLARSIEARVGVELPVTEGIGWMETWVVNKHLWRKGEKAFLLMIERGFTSDGERLFKNGYRDTWMTPEQENLRADSPEWIAIQKIYAEEKAHEKRWHQLRTAQKIIPPFVATLIAGWQIATGAYALPIVLMLIFTTFLHVTSGSAVGWVDHAIQDARSEWDKRSLWIEYFYVRHLQRPAVALAMAALMNQTSVPFTAPQFIAVALGALVMLEIIHQLHPQRKRTDVNESLVVAVADIIAAVDSNDERRILSAAVSLPTDLSLHVGENGKVKKAAPNVVLDAFLKDPTSQAAVRKRVQSIDTRLWTHQQRTKLQLILGAGASANVATARALTTMALDEKKVPAFVLDGTESDNQLALLKAVFEMRPSLAFVHEGAKNIAQIQKTLGADRVQIYSGDAHYFEVKQLPSNTAFLVKPDSIRIDDAGKVLVLRLEDILPVLHEALDTKMKATVMALIAA